MKHKPNTQMTTETIKPQKLLWGTRKGEPDYMEQLITEREDRIEAATQWAKDNGFDRIRVSTWDGSAPNWGNTLNVRGEYLGSLLGIAREIKSREEAAQ